MCLPADADARIFVSVYSLPFRTPPHFEERHEDERREILLLLLTIDFAPLFPYSSGELIPKS